MKKHSSDTLRELKLELTASFDVIKENPLDFNLLLSHIGLLSSVLSNLIDDELESRDED